LGAYSQFGWARYLAPKAKVTRSNRVRCAITAMRSLECLADNLNSSSPTNYQGSDKVYDRRGFDLHRRALRASMVGHRRPLLFSRELTASSSKGLTQNHRK
jgi:hypothetical protein